MMRSGFVARGRTRCGIAFGGLVLVWVLGLMLGGCGASRSSSIPDIGAAVGVVELVEIPEDRAGLEALSVEEPCDPSHALLVAYARELLGDPDGALRVLTGEDGWRADPLLSTARAIAIYRLRDSSTDFDEVAGAWLAREGISGVHPYETWLRTELSHFLAVRASIRDDAPERASGVSLGHPDTWTFYGPQSVMDALPWFESSAALRVSSLDELPTSSARRRALIAPNASRVEAPEGVSGTVYFEAFLHLSAPLDALLVVQSSGNYHVWIGGVEVDRRGPEGASTIAQQAHVVSLDAGVHRVLVQVGSRVRPSLSFRLVPLAGAIDAFDAAAVPVSTGGVRVSRLDRGSPMRWFPSTGAAPGSSEALVSWLARAEIAGMSLDAEAIASLLDAGEAFSHPLAQWMKARLWRGNLAWPVGARQNQMMHALRALGDEWRPLSGVDELVVELLAGSSQHSSAKEWLDAGGAGVRSPRLVLQHAEVLRALGFNALAEVMLQDLQARYPRWCPAVEALMNAWIARGVPVTERALASSEGQCSQARAQLAWSQWASAGDWAKVVAHSANAVARGPSRMENWRRYLRALLLDEAFDDAENALNDAERWGMTDDELARYRADLAFARGQDDVAEQTIVQRRDARPWDVDLQHQASFAQGEATLQDLRKDGLAIAREWFSREDRARAEVVYVLDYAAWRYFDTTGGVSLVHQIIQLNSRDAIAQWGEVGAPAGNTLLTIRVIKPDGSVRVPEMIAGKDSISMPSLAVGDLVEVEYLSSIGAIARDEDFHDTSLFYFASDSAEMAHSEFVVEYPQAWSDAAELELRNFDGHHEASRKDGRVRERMWVEDVPVFLPEPSMPAVESVLPTARFVFSASEAKLLRAYQNRVVSALSSAPPVVEMAQRLVDGASTARERAQRIFRFVNDEVVDQNGFFSQNALPTLHTLQGDRFALLVSLLEAAGFSVDVALARSFGDDEVHTELPSFASYGTAALRVTAGRDEFWLMAAGKSTPFDWVLPEIQGQDALVVYGPSVARHLTVPREDAPEKQQTRAHIQLHADGSADVEVHEILSMEASAYGREDLEYMPNPEDRQRYLEYELSAQFPGLVIENYEILYEHEADRPLERRYRFRVPELAVAQGDAMFLDRGFFVATRAYYNARLDRRRYPLISTYTYDETLAVTLDVDPGLVIDADMEPVDAAWRGISFQRTATRSESTQSLTWTRTLRVPMMKIESDDYAQYADFMRDLAVQERVRLTIRRAQP